ncbi:MAG: bifunctional (p)ppGpp synthetase/guanosine-3',5'-bis(diphosphate) 3'-pyrophosphohydrolase [Candidatus Margulisiibacteriota bacterium]
MTFEELKNKILAYNKNSNLELLTRVCKFAEEKHKSHFRLSGEPFIQHPLTVAFILAELEQDDFTIAAALLHDTVEDCGVTLEEISASFTPEIAVLVEGVTKLGQLTYESREKRQAENFRKMFVAMGRDLRVIIIKLADRLHNMRTLQFLPPEKRLETSKETIEIFAPLAHRLGIWKMKWELEDLSFSFLMPEKYQDIKKKISESREAREKNIDEFIKKLKQVLKNVGIEGYIYGRPKHFYSVYRKMHDQNRDFSDIYDLTAVRLILKTVKECYTALGIVHATWKPIPGRFRDFIAVPKSNGYQSLHTTVMGRGGRPMEIQIRTEEMHRMAEYGVASHWVYKEGEADEKFNNKIAWLRQMLEWQTEMKDARDFMDNLKVGLFEEEVFVFSPKGDVYQLQTGSTPVDFAYHVHTEIGHRCVGARVNGKIMPISYKLQNGDIVEVLTGKADNPRLDWLNIAKTPAARSKVKSWFKRRKREESVEQGKMILDAELKKNRVHPKKLLTVENLELLKREFKAKNSDELFFALGCGDISALDCYRRLMKHLGTAAVEVEPEIPAAPRKRKYSQGVRVTGLSGILIKMSKCCRPLPGDQIVGLVTKGKGVSVHRKDCHNIKRLKLPEDRMVEVEWEKQADICYPIELEVEAFDRVGVFKDILGQVAETQTNVASATVTTKRGSTAFLKLAVDVKNIEHLQKVIKAIRDISDVYEVRKLEE